MYCSIKSLSLSHTQVRQSALLALKYLLALAPPPPSSPLGLAARQMVYILQGYLAHKKHPPPKDHHRFLGIGLL